MDIDPRDIPKSAPHESRRLLAAATDEERSALIERYFALLRRHPRAAVSLTDFAVHELKRRRREPH